MCGIAGVVQRDGSPVTDPLAVTATLGRALAHRGPDGAGAWGARAGGGPPVHPRPPPPSVTATLGRALAHRGPDGAGAWRSPEGDALLVHRRLAIIDLSADGAPPVASGDGRVGPGFYGEGY